MNKITLLLIATAVFLQACSYVDRYVTRKLTPNVNVNVNVNANIDTTCMDNIDQKELDALEKRANEMKNEVEALCKSGKRDAAQQKAMQYANEINNSEIMKQLRECTIKSGINQITLPGISTYGDGKSESRHVCDN